MILLFSDLSKDQTQEHVSLVAENKYWPTKKHTSLASVPKSPLMKNVCRARCEGHRNCHYFEIIVITIRYHDFPLFMNSAGAFVSRNLRWALEAIHRVSLTLILTLIITLTNPNPTLGGLHLVSTTCRALLSGFARQVTIDKCARVIHKQRIVVITQTNGDNTEKSIRCAPLVKRD